jgi:hypothetical protein
MSITPLCVQGLHGGPPGGSREWLSLFQKLPMWINATIIDVNDVVALYQYPWTCIGEHEKCAYCHGQNQLGTANNTFPPNTLNHSLSLTLITWIVNYHPYLAFTNRVPGNAPPLQSQQGGVALCQWCQKQRKQSEKLTLIHCATNCASRTFLWIVPFWIMNIFRLWRNSNAHLNGMGPMDPMRCMLSCLCWCCSEGSYLNPHRKTLQCCVPLWDSPPSTHLTVSTTSTRNHDSNADCHRRCSREMTQQPTYPIITLDRIVARDIESYNLHGTSALVNLFRNASIGNRLLLIYSTLGNLSSFHTICIVVLMIAFSGWGWVCSRSEAHVYW